MRRLMMIFSLLLLMWGGAVWAKVNEKGTVSLVGAVQVSGSDAVYSVKGRFQDKRNPDSGLLEKITGVNGAIIEGVMTVSAPDAGGIRKANIAWNAASVQRPGGSIDGSIKRTLFQSPLASGDVEVTGDSLGSGTVVGVAGDLSAAIAAVKAAATSEAKKSPASSPAGLLQNGRSAVGQAEPPSVASGGASGGSPTIGGNNNGNELARYKPLALPQSAPVAEKHTPLIGLSTDGCKIEIDPEGRYAFETSRKTEDGVGVGACSDNNNHFPILKNYQVCGDDKSAIATDGFVYAMYKRYFVAKGVSSDIDTKCTRDTVKKFKVDKDVGNCVYREDLGAGMAHRQVSSFYIDGNNERRAINGAACFDDPAAAPVPIVKAVSDCKINDDFGSGTSTQYMKKIYTVDGLEHVAQGCSPIGSVYAQYKDRIGCARFADYTAMKEYPQEKTMIKVDGVPLARTQCQVVTAEGLNITETLDGCTSTFFDYPQSGQSFGSSRFYVTENAAQRFITVCQQSTVSYPHQQRINGYLLHDDLLKADPKIEIYFAGPAGDHLVEAAKVRPGVAMIDYTPGVTAIKPTGAFNYEVNGCRRYAKQATFQTFTRPDSTTFEKNMGPAPDGSPVYDCISTISTTWTKKSATWVSYYLDVSGAGYMFQADGLYVGTKTLTRGDGVIISQTQGEGTWPTCYSGVCNWTCTPGRPAVVCAGSTANTSLINQFRIQLGW